MDVCRYEQHFQYNKQDKQKTSLSYCLSFRQFSLQDDTIGVALSLCNCTDVNLRPEFGLVSSTSC